MGNCFSVDVASQRPSLIVAPNITNLQIHTLFYAWRLIVQASKHRYELDLAHGRLAALHQQIADNESTVENAHAIVARSHTATHRNTNWTPDVCVVCFDSTKTKMACCSRGKHNICLECISKLCDECKDVDEIECPYRTEGCTGILCDDVIGQTSGGQCVFYERQHRKTLALMFTILRKTDDRVFLRMRYLQRDGSFSALQCSQCGYGPMEHSRCDDLREYHQKDGVNNHCPQCHHFEECVTRLEKWDGQ